MTINTKVLVVITGPTASGKTDAAIRLARRLGTEIISADSRQFFRELRIGTATPSPEQLSLAPHHFIGHLSIHDKYHVAQFEKEALILLGQLFESHDEVVMVGGSGLYIDAVCYGFDLLPDPDPEYRAELHSLLKSHGIKALQQLLLTADPEYYRTVDLNNGVRLIRALEVVRATGVPISSLRTATPAQRPFRIVKFGLMLPREELNRRIDARTDQMIRDGLVEEARRLFPFRELNALNTVGYKELFTHFDGNSTLDHAVEKIKTNTRRYAKRQMTWFRRDPLIRWADPSEELYW